MSPVLANWPIEEMTMQANFTRWMQLSLDGETVSDDQFATLTRFGLWPELTTRDENGDVSCKLIDSEVCEPRLAQNILFGYLDDKHIDHREMAQLEELGLWPDELVIHVNGHTTHRENVCEIDGEYHSEDDCVTVGNEYVLRDDAAYCEQCAEYCLSDDSCTVYNPRHREQTWCETCRSNDAYYWDSDSEYHSEPEPDDSDDDCDDDEISSYHAHDVSPSRPSELAEDVIGVEMETYWPNTANVANWMHNEGMTPDDGWKAEHDSSLDSQHGVEIVSKPFRYGELIHAHDDNPWFALFQFARGKSRAWDMGRGYGLHLSINRAKMSQLHAIKFSRFINGNPELCCALAGRKSTGYSDFKKTDVKSQQEQHGAKYLACAMRSTTRIEVRIFRASWNWERFVRNCQFVESVRRYTRDCSLSDVALSDSAYLRWIAKQPAGEFRTLRAWFADHKMTTHENALALAERPAIAE